MYDIFIRLYETNATDSGFIDYTANLNIVTQGEKYSNSFMAISNDYYHSTKNY